MQYRRFIEDYFQIDTPETGELIPFRFRPVQNKYYDELIRDYDFERKGISSASRDIILKARRQGFSSLILAIFAVDDLLNLNPTETLVISYKDDATKTFRNKYKTFILSYFAKKWGKSLRDMNEKVERLIFSENEGGSYRLKHNKAHFYCGTASGRTAERGGVTHKLLFSEAAHYPDVEKLTAREIMEGTLRQVDVKSGMVFIESTANGYGNHYEKTWNMAVRGESRFIPRFYSWREFYTKEEYDLAYRESTDKEVFKQEMPGTPQEAFIFSGSPYFDNEKIHEYLINAPEPKERGIFEEGKVISQTKGPFYLWERPDPFQSYVIGGDVAEGIEGGDNSVLIIVNNKTLKTAAKFKGRISPDEFAKIAYDIGKWYNFAYMGIEVNKDGLWVNTELFKMGYPNLYYREELDDITNRIGHRVGFRTDERTRPYILSELRKTLALNLWNNREFLEECLCFVRNKMGRPQAMSGKNDDEIMATAIAYEIRRNAPSEFEKPPEDRRATRDEIIEERLRRLYKDVKVGISQDQYV